MIVETNLVDLSKVKANDPTTWNNRVKFEIPRQWGVKNIRKRKRESKTEDERKQAIKEYQHNYYLQVTKPKRQEARKNVK